LAQIDGGVIGALASGAGPEVQGIAGSATLEAVECVLLQVGGEAAAGAGRGTVQGARAALLGSAAVGLEAEQLQDGRHRNHGTQGGEVDGRA